MSLCIDSDRPKSPGWGSFVLESFGLRCDRALIKLEAEKGGNNKSDSNAVYRWTYLT